MSGNRRAHIRRENLLLRPGDSTRLVTASCVRSDSVPCTSRNSASITSRGSGRMRTPAKALWRFRRALSRTNPYTSIAHSMGLSSLRPPVCDEADSPFWVSRSTPWSMRQALRLISCLLRGCSIQKTVRGPRRESGLAVGYRPRTAGCGPNLHTRPQQGYLP